MREITTEDGNFVVNDIPAGTYDVLIQANTPNSVQNVRIKGVELKQGYLCGEDPAELKVVAIKRNQAD